MPGMSITPSGSETLNMWGDNNGGDRGAYKAGAGFVGGAILGGGVGYFLSKEVGDLKGQIGETKADIAKSQASIEKEVSGVTMNLKDQICEAEKLITNEAQRTNGLLGGFADSVAARFAGTNERIGEVGKEVLRSEYQRALDLKDVQKQISDCCCQTNIKLTELECCCQSNYKALSTQMECFKTDIENKLVIQSKDAEIQRLKDLAITNERFCTLEKGQEAILAKLNQHEAIVEAKREAVEKFKLDQLYNAMMGSKSGGSAS